VRYFARIGERTYECVIEPANGALHVTVDGRRHRADLRHIPASHTYSLLLDGRSYEFALREEEGETELSGGAGGFRVLVEDARTHAARQATLKGRESAGPRMLRAAMPGIVREVLAAEGAAVEKGEALLILEAMKMQNEIRADRGAVVRALHVAAGDTVEKGQLLAELE